MRLALFALLLALPLTACDPDAAADTETPAAEAEPVPTEPAPIDDEGPIGDTGLPDTLMSAPGADAPEVMEADGAPDVPSE